MSQSTAPSDSCRGEESAIGSRGSGTGHASLAALGTQLRRREFFAPVAAMVRVPQKTIRYAPADKLYDLWIGILAGIQGIGEINRVLRADPALQRAFGRTACAEQSVIQDTLNACTPENVAQLAEAVAAIFRRYSRAARHRYTEAWLLLDVDTSGMPCGRKAEFATKGYFAGKRNRRGRQLGRVLATDYQEIVVDQLYDGKTQLNTALPGLMRAAEAVLQTRPEERERTLVRVDAGGGTLADVNDLDRKSVV